MYFECVFVALGIQHAMRMRHTAICVLTGYTLFFHTTSNDRIKKIVIEHKMCVWFSLQLLSATFLTLGRNDSDMITHVSSTLHSCPILMKPGFFNIN